MFIILVFGLAMVSVSNCQINSIIEVKINETYCSKSICHGMNFTSQHEVVSFEPDNNNHQKLILFENSSLSNFPLNLFLAFTKLTELDMRNCSISHITWENFLWAVDLKVLLLSNNSLIKINELVFNYALNMQFLWIDHNRIENLVNESFKGLGKLKYLSLLGNRIVHIPNGLFDDLQSLEVVILAENRIKYIENNVFTKSANIMSIDLKDNRIKNISNDAFKGFTNLISLDISHNKFLRRLILNVDVSHFRVESCSLRQLNIYGSIKFAFIKSNRILELYFSRPESLYTLELKNNSLQQIASLTRSKNLKNLDLSDNPELESVPDPWFVNSLEKLDLSNTGLREFPVSVLAQEGIPLKMFFLNISNNSIKQIDPKIFSRLENITNFYFHANNWNCFHLRLMMDLLVNPTRMSYSSDKSNTLFPGEYIGGVKCMYRVIEDEYDDIAPMKTKPFSATEEINELRLEVKAILRFYEEKFDKVMKSLDDLKTRLDTLTVENATVWKHITIST